MGSFIFTLMNSLFVRRKNTREMWWEAQSAKRAWHKSDRMSHSTQKQVNILISWPHVPYYGILKLRIDSVRQSVINTDVSQEKSELDILVPVTHSVEWVSEIYPWSPISSWSNTFLMRRLPAVTKTLLREKNYPLLCTFFHFFMKVSMNHFSLSLSRSHQALW